MRSALQRITLAFFLGPWSLVIGPSLRAQPAGPPTDVTLRANPSTGALTGTPGAALFAAGNGLLTTAAAASGYQPLDADLTAIAALTTTSYGRATLSLADAAAGRTYFGVVIGTNVQAYSSALDTFAANGSAYYLARGNHTGTQAWSTLTGTPTTLSGYGITDAQGLDADLTSWAAITRAAGFDAFAATPSSANLASLVTGETGSGALVFGTSPTLTTPAIGAATGTSLTLSAGLTVSGKTTLGADGASFAWTSAVPVIDISSASAFYGSGNVLGAASNAYFDGAWKYKATNPASYWEMNTTQFAFNTASSGSAAASISFTPRLTITATTGTLSGNLTVSGTGATSLGGPGATVAIAGTSAVRGIRTASATLDFPSVAATGGTQDLTITVTGAATGDSVALGLPAAPSAGITFDAWVSASNTVTVRATNATGVSVDPASASYRATVTSF